MDSSHSRIISNQGRIKIVWAPGWNLERGSFCIYETVVTRINVNERTEVLVLLK